MLDAGLDLGKTPAQSAVLLRESAVHAGLGYPLLLSASNKRFIGELLGREIDDRRDESLAAVAYGVACGCRIVRVHDVRGQPSGVPHDRGAARRGRAPTPVREVSRVMTITLVQGSDPSLRDREVQRVVDELLGGVDRSLALDDHTIESRRRARRRRRRRGRRRRRRRRRPAHRSSCPTFAAVVNAVQSPPFMTECRVVVVREIGNLTSEQGKWLAEWIADPLDGVHLVLVAGGGRVPTALDKACKANGRRRRRRAASRPPPCSRSELQGRAPAARAPTRRTRIAAHLGDDAGRVPELVELLRATYGANATLDVDAVEPYLGELGTAGRFDLTNAIDRGDLGAALEVLHRMLTATSAPQPKPLHPMQVMASLVFHYQRLLRLDDPSITTKEQAAEVLGMKSAGGARFPLEAARRLGSDGLREALGLLAQAELDLRGQSGLDERTAIDVLVARLAALSRRHARGSDPRASVADLAAASRSVGGRRRCARASSGARCGGRPGSCG